MYICVYTWRLYRVACRTHMMGRSNRNLCAFLARLTRQKENIEMGGGGKKRPTLLEEKGVEEWEYPFRWMDIYFDQEKKKKTLNRIVQSAAINSRSETGRTVCKTETKQVVLNSSKSFSHLSQLPLRLISFIFLLLASLCYTHTTGTSLDATDCWRKSNDGTNPVVFPTLKTTTPQHFQRINVIHIRISAAFQHTR